MCTVLNKDTIETEIVPLIAKQKRGFPPTVPLVAIHQLLKVVPKLNIKEEKKRKITNVLYLTDRQGLPLTMSESISGNHNDFHDIEVQFEAVTATLKEANIPVEGVFLNADAGFDSKNFRETCDKKEINANVCFNKRNGNAEDREEYFDQDLYN